MMNERHELRLGEWPGCGVDVNRLPSGHVSIGVWDGGSDQEGVAAYPLTPEDANRLALALLTPQPMETAPRDGRDVLAWHPSRGWRLARWDRGVWVDRISNTPFDGYVCLGWLPLPPAPMEGE